MASEESKAVPTEKMGDLKLDSGGMCINKTASDLYLPPCLTLPYASYWCCRKIVACYLTVLWY